MELANVKCDLCKWEQPIDFDAIPEWHDKPCPKCNKCIIVNDDDLSYWRVLKSLLVVQDIFDPNAEQPRKTVHVDTSPLREGKPVDIK